MNKLLNNSIHKSLVFLILFYCVTTYADKNVKNEGQKSKSGNQLLIDGLNSSNIITFQDLVYLTKIGIIDGRASKKYKRILRQIKSKVSKRAKAEIILQTTDAIEVVIYHKDKQSQPWFKVKWLFKNKTLIQGPIFIKLLKSE